MRKALIGILAAATMLTPAIAQVSDADRERAAQRYQRQGERNAARAERREARQAARAEQQVPQEQAQARQQQRLERRADRREDRRGAFRQRIRETREANRAADAGVIPSYRRQGDINQARYEERLRARRDNRRDWRQDRRADRRDYRQDRRDWNRSWRNDRRYDWQRYRYANRGLYSLGRYYAPYRNHSYSRFGIGFTLGSGFYSNRYWLNNPWQYRLPPAHAGTQWVRYYDDVLLVDLYTGEVLDVIYNFFW